MLVRVRHCLCLTNSVCRSNIHNIMEQHIYTHSHTNTRTLRERERERERDCFSHAYSCVESLFAGGISNCILGSCDEITCIRVMLTIGGGGQGWRSFYDLKWLVWCILSDVTYVTWLVPCDFCYVTYVTWLVWRVVEDLDWWRSCARVTLRLGASLHCCETRCCWRFCTFFMLVNRNSVIIVIAA